MELRETIFISLGDAVGRLLGRGSREGGATVRERRRLTLASVTSDATATGPPAIEIDGEISDQPSGLDGGAEMGVEAKFHRKTRAGGPNERVDAIGEGGEALGVGGPAQHADALALGLVPLCEETHLSPLHCVNPLLALARGGESGRHI